MRLREFASLISRHRHLTSLCRSSAGWKHTVVRCSRMMTTVDVARIEQREETVAAQSRDEFNSCGSMLRNSGVIRLELPLCRLIVLVSMDINLQHGLIRRGRNRLSLTICQSLSVVGRMDRRTTTVESRITRTYGRRIPSLGPLYHHRRRLRHLADKYRRDVETSAARYMPTMLTPGSLAT
jgi:hypothetical protein